MGWWSDATLRHSGIDAVRIDYADVTVRKEENDMPPGSTTSASAASTTGTGASASATSAIPAFLVARCAFPYLSLDDHDQLQAEHCEILLS